MRPSKGTPITASWANGLAAQVQAATLRGRGVTSSPVGTTVSSDGNPTPRPEGARLPFEVWIARGPSEDLRLLIQQGLLYTGSGTLDPGAADGLVASQLVPSAYEISLPSGGARRNVAVEVIPPDPESASSAWSAALRFCEPKTKPAAGGYMVTIAEVTGYSEMSVGKVTQRMIGDIALGSSAAKEPEGYTGDIKIITELLVDYYAKTITAMTATVSVQDGLVKGVMPDETGTLVATLAPEVAW